MINRFKNFNFGIGLISRLQSETQNKKTLENLKTGKINFIIGTHKLLSKKVLFRDLGLLIIDEEQRFGVEQKEKIKERCNNIDVLTLSATPIPRTLQSTLIGIKTISSITTSVTSSVSSITDENAGGAKLVLNTNITVIMHSCVKTIIRFL